MTGEQLRAARLFLGLTGDQMATMLGYDCKDRRSIICRMERSRSRVRHYHARLVEAYLSGYRPPDWPVTETPQERVKVYAPMEIKPTNR